MRKNLLRGLARLQRLFARLGPEQAIMQRALLRRGRFGLLVDRYRGDGDRRIARRKRDGVQSRAPDGPAGAPTERPVRIAAPIAMADVELRRQSAPSSFDRDLLRGQSVRCGNTSRTS